MKTASSFLILCAIWHAAHAQAIDIGTRLEPFVDTFLIDAMDNVALQLHHPTPREIALTTDAPWEGNTSCYVTVFEDGDLFRMYYRGSNYDMATKKSGDQLVCYAESTDGVRWTKPELGIVEYEGSTANNIIWDGEGSHNFAPFRDTNPDCAPEAQYKALASGPDKAKLLPFQSADGVHWSLIREEAVITEGAFDSQNPAFWDSARGHYVEFHRGFTDGVRAIMTSTSPDFINWTQPKWLDYGDTPPEHLYTNATIAYPRAPHIYMAFPKRFVPSRTGQVHPIPGVSDAVFMTSRDGLHWNRWREAFVRPGLQDSRWVNRNNMTAWGILRTKGALPETPDEYSLYLTEGYYVGPCHYRRFTIRQDGFVSVNAPGEGGEFTTKVLSFGDDPDITRAAIPSTAGSITDAAIIGARSLKVENPATMRLPGTQHFGTQVTLAAHVRKVPAGHRRLFSAYNGGAVETTQGELWFDFDASGNDMGIRFCANGRFVETQADQLPDWSGDDTIHHLAATWNDGVLTIYFDGEPVATGGDPGGGELNLVHGDVLFGEDYPPTTLTNEPFLGTADDLFVVRRALTPVEIQAIAKDGAQATLEASATDGDILYTFEENGPENVRNALGEDGTGDTALPGYRGPTETELIINVSTSAAGTVRCEIQDESGTPIPGYTLEDCDAIFGDAIERAVTWNGQSEIKALVGRPVRLRFVMNDADLYAVRFR